MKKVKPGITKESAMVQLQIYSTASIVLSLIGLVSFKLIGFAGLAFAAMAYSLANHSSTRNIKNKKRYTAMSVIGATIGILNIILFRFPA